jgi:hypothetical protein
MSSDCWSGGMAWADDAIVQLSFIYPKAPLLLGGETT